jgi:uncharacterized protein YciU (UPF0263 family)
MITKKIFIYLLSGILFLSVFSCKDGDEGNNESNSGNSDENSQANIQNDLNVICIWSAVSLKKEPSEKGKYITTMYLGEAGTTSGESVTDSSTSKPKEYLKIKLADGTEGWIQKNLTAIDSKSYAVKSRTKLYQRPDILSATKKEFETMQYVEVLETQDDWLKVKGKKIGDTWFSEGWVKLENLTENDVDVTVAVLAERAMNEADDEKKLKALNEILGNPDLESSIFISSVRDLTYEYSDEEIYEDYGD